MLDIIAKEHRAIRCSTHEKVLINGVLIAIYAPAQNHEKHAFWNHLKSLNDIFTLPWCILSDFNEMLHSFENIGGTSLCASKL